jgi:Tfp pilus assembly protein PilX
MNPITSTKQSVSRRVSDERGVALFLALILLSTLSVLTVSMMFLSQSESISSGNYRLMTQARYGAEAGVQKAADYIAHTYDPTPLTGAFWTAYQAAPTSPVLFGGAPLVLSSSADPNHASNYPDAATITAFQGATQGQVVAGNSKINYTTYATLISMDKFVDAYSGLNKVVQTWEITSDAQIQGVHKSTVEVTAIIDTPKGPAISYAAFATSPLCDSLHFLGDVRTNSYNSADPDYHPFTTNPVTGLPVANPTYTPPLYCPAGPNSGPGCMDNTGGDVGTNGNLDISGHVDVKGNLSSPITGVGSCVNNNGVASTALTQTGVATVEGGAPLELPQTVKLPTPKTPPTTPYGPVSLSSATVANACLYLNGYTAPFALGAVPLPGCSVSGNTVTLAAPPGLTLPPLTLSDQVAIVLTAQPTNPAIGVLAQTANSMEYDFSSITLTGQSSIAVKTDTPSHSVSVYLSGKNSDNTNIGTVIDFQGGASASDATFGAVQGCQLCSTFDASLMGFFYSGAGNINLVGNSAAAATFFAPNAYATFGGTSDLYGSIIANTLYINGGGGGPNGISVNYDQSLSGQGLTAGWPMISSFSWKKY